jgi:hypothetical protein
MQYGWLRRGLAGGAFAALGGVALVQVFPVYFRADDALHLEWASSHPNPLAAFVPAQATVLGVFRPLQSLAWWSLYRLFGLRPEPYQLLVTLLFIACLDLFVRLGRRMFSKDAAWWSLGAFLTFFPYLISVAFWFSDLSFLLESVLMLAAVIFLMEALAGRVRFAWGVGAYLLAVLAKEPAAFIVPAAGAALLLAEWRGLESGVRRKGTVVMAGLAATGVAAVLLHPSLRGRQGALLAGGWSGFGAFVGERWQLYANQLLAGAGAGLVALALLAVWLRIRPDGGPRTLGIWVPIATALGAALLLRRTPGLGVAVMLACLLAQVVLRRREGVGAVWFAVPFLGLLTIAFAVRTYLFEAAFGLALVAGTTLAELATEVWAGLRRMPRTAVTVLTGALVLTLIFGGPPLVASVRTRLAALELVSAARLNFRHVVSRLLESECPPGPVVVVDYADMGLDYARDIVPLPDIQKAQRQKTMMAHELAAYLRVAGRHDLTVVTLSEFMRLPVGTGALLVVMNTTEDGMVGGLLGQRHLLVESIRRGELARLYRVVR